MAIVDNMWKARNNSKSIYYEQDIYFVNCLYL